MIDIKELRHDDGERERASDKLLDGWRLPASTIRFAFAPDSRHLALVNPDGSAYLLRLATPDGKLYLPPPPLFTGPLFTNYGCPPDAAATKALRVPMPLGSLLHDRFVRLLAQGGEDLDWSAIGQRMAADVALPR